METTELSRRVFESLGASDSPELFEENLAARDVELEWSPNRAGVKFRPVGSTTWLKGSSTSRDLSASRIISALARNADLRREARQAAESVTAAADASTQPQKDDALDFLPLPGATALSPIPKSDLDDEDAQQQRLARERADAEAELDAKLQKMELEELYDLSKCAQLPPVLMSMEALVHLVNLMMRILSFGLIEKRANVFADLRVAKEALSERANQEIQRRKRTPASVAERLKFLSVESNAVASRKTLLEARAGMFWTQKPSAVARAVVERQHDHAAVQARSPTIAAHRLAIGEIGTRVEAREREIVEADEQIPVGIAGALMSRTDAVQRARAHLVALRSKQDEDTKRRDRLAKTLDDLITEFEAKFAAEIAAEEARVKAERVATAEEIERLRLELRHRIPEARRAIERSTVTEQFQPHTPAEPTAAEDASQAERDRMRRSLGKG